MKNDRNVDCTKIVNDFENSILGVHTSVLSFPKAIREEVFLGVKTRIFSPLILRKFSQVHYSHANTHFADQISRIIRTSASVQIDRRNLLT